MRRSTPSPSRKRAEGNDEKPGRIRAAGTMRHAHMTSHTEQDIPSYSQFIQSAAATPPAPRRAVSADEINRMNADANALITVARKELAACVVEQLHAMQQHRVGDADARVAIENVKRATETVLAEFTAGDKDAQRNLARRACDMLHLHRACEHGNCRKAQACRGHAMDCYPRAGVPEQAADWVATLMLAERLPWMMASGRAEDRLAYECWIAGIEARANLRAQTNHQRRQP